MNLQQEAKQKHPKGLMVLFYTEMWERFSYYGMRALLVLYLTTGLAEGGFGLERDAALKIYATFTGLVYLTPILGGYLADRFLGQRKAVYIGAFLMAIGQFFMASSEFGDFISREDFRNLGLGLIIVGTGFFKANISTIVGDLYTENDPRKDSAFTLFYMGINIGALFGPFIAGYLGQQIDWFWGFGAAGIGMILSTVWFFAQRKKLGNSGMPPGRKSGDEIILMNSRDRWDIFLFTIGSAAIVWSVLKLWSFISADTQLILLWNVIALGTVILAYIILKNTKGKTAWSKLSVILILALFNVFFWSGYEQAGGTFNLFAQHNVNRTTIFGEFPASWFQSVPALFIVLLAPVIAIVWIKLKLKNKEPATPAKFGIGLILMSAGFVIMNLASKQATESIIVSPIWLLMVYFMHTLGELCLSPIGLSMVTKLAPQKIISVMMGLWFASIALANYLAGILENILNTYLPNVPLYIFLTFTTLVAGIILLILSPILRKMMSDVR